MLATFIEFKKRRVQWKKNFDYSREIIGVLIIADQIKRPGYFIELI